MPVQQVSFKNTSTAKQNQQNNVAFTPVSRNSTGDTVEISSKKKENKVLKYAIIGTGTLASIIAVINHKKIGELFEKKSPLIPAEDILKKIGAEEEFIEKSKGKGYQLWHFTSNKFLNEFINSHEDLSKITFYNLKEIQDKSKDKCVKKFINAVKNKTGVNLLDEVTHYRFIGQSELDAIKTKQPIKSTGYLGSVYMTVCPDYGLSCGSFDYRITYKSTKNIKENVTHYHDTQFKTYIDTPYTVNDIDKVEKLVDGKWQVVEF